ncbi:hypothetical protein ACF1B0_28550 [Streptomyces anandii]|uniref:hypothetical protein n=1 Tax=Streptomyces anandii TaxID=285454 RepID=UPI003701213C
MAEPGPVRSGSSRPGPSGPEVGGSGADDSGAGGSAVPQSAGVEVLREAGDLMAGGLGEAGHWKGWASLA